MLRAGYVFWFNKKLAQAHVCVLLESCYVKAKWVNFSISAQCIKSESVKIKNCVSSSGRRDAMCGSGFNGAD